MAVRALYEMKDTPLPLAIDLYVKTIVPAIDKSSEKAYTEIVESLEYDMIASSGDTASDWSSDKNSLYFTHGYTNLFKNAFENPIKAIWTAHESLSLIFTCHPDYKAADLHVFYWKGNRFLVKHENIGILFLTPEEY